MVDRYAPIPQWLWLFVLALAISIQTGCGAGTVPPEVPVGGAAARAPNPSQPGTVRPTIVRRENGELWVTNLPRDHGWDRHKRAIVLIRDEVLGEEVKVGVVSVLDDWYKGSAPVGVVYVEEGVLLEGAYVVPSKGDQRLRITKAFGRLSRITDSHSVQIDLGVGDGVAVGDIYEVRSASGIEAVGRVQVTRVDDSRAEAAVLGALDGGELVLGREVIFQRGAQPEPPSSAVLRVVVCDFTPKAQQATAAGQAIGFDLVAHVKKETDNWQGLDVVQVHQTVNSPEEARQLGKRHAADIVVWGSVHCDGNDACAQPMFTVVDQEKVATAQIRGKEVTFPRLRPYKGLQGGRAGDPANFTFVLLGELAFESQRYEDAAYYLGRAMKDGLDKDDALRAYEHLGEAEYALGRIDAAVETLAAMQRHLQRKDHRWELVAKRQRARLLVAQGKIDAGERLFGELRAAYKDPRDQQSLALVLAEFGRALAKAGKLDAARVLIQESLSNCQSSDDPQLRGTILEDLALVAAQIGYRDALATLHKRLDIVKALGDRRLVAQTLGDIASIHVKQKEPIRALPLFRESYQILAKLDDLRGIATVGESFAELLVETGSRGEADAVIERVSGALLQIGDRDRATALRGLLSTAAAQLQP